MSFLGTLLRLIALPAAVMLAAWLFGRSVSLLALGSAATVGLFWLGDLIQRRRARERSGWRYLSPGPLEWFTLVGCLGMTLLFLWVHIFVGIARPDPESQYLALRLLILGFGAGSVVMLLFSFEVETRWNDERIEHRRFSSGWKAIRFAEIVDHGESLSGHVFCESADGTRIGFSPYANGAPALVEAMIDAAGDPQYEP